MLEMTVAAKRDVFRYLRCSIAIVLWVAACSTERGAVPDLMGERPGEGMEPSTVDGDPQRDAGGDNGPRAPARDAGRDARVGTIMPPDRGRDASPGPGREDPPARVDGSVANDTGTPPAADAGEPPPVSDACPAEAPRAVNRVRVLAATGKGAELVGAKVQGSNSGPTTDFVDLATLERAPENGRFAEVRFTNDTRYRYVKLYVERGAGSVAELELYRDGTRMSGEAFGTIPADGSALESAFDGAPGTAFSGSLPSGNYVGLDIGKNALAAAPTFAPPAGMFSTAPEVTLSSSTPAARIRYTLDGSNPTRTSGTVYEGAIRPAASGRTTIKAIASADCLFDSQVVSASYEVGTSPPPPPPGETRGLKSYHIGNSLTDTINDWLEPIADSTGVDHVYSRWTIPGAPVAWIWDHPGSGFGTPEGAENITTFARSFAPIDHMSVQPFSDPSLEPQAGAAIKMYEAVRSASPNVQLWIYAQWPSSTEWNADSLATGAGWAMPSWSVPKQPTNWEEALANQLLYHEAFRKWVDDRVEGKQVLIVPGGPALVALKRAIEAGNVPGISNFFATHFDDDLHLTAKGQYLVSLVFYACLYRQSPEGRVTSANSTLTDAQAKIYQRIAWDTARSYRWSGLTP